MLRLLMFLLLMLYAQFIFESRIEHKVLSEVESFPSVFRIDEDFNRSFASIYPTGNIIKNSSFENEKWRISKYIKPDLNIRESMSIQTIVNTAKEGDICLGSSRSIKLSLVSFQKGKILVLKNEQSNEYLELIPTIKINSNISQKLKTVSSAIKKRK